MNANTPGKMARHIILESGCPVNLDYLVVACRENDQYYLMLFGIDRKISITEKDFQAVCDAVKKEWRPGKEVADELSRLTIAIRNLYELLRARLR